MKKKILSLLLVLTMLLSSVAMLGITVGAEEATVIDTPADFANIANAPTADYIITVDELDFTNVTDFKSIPEFSGNISCTSPSGKCVIKNLSVDCSAQTLGVGIIGCLAGGTVDGLVIDDSCKLEKMNSEKTGLHIGMIVGYAMIGSKISNCENNADMTFTTSNTLGGIIGTINSLVDGSEADTTVIENCVNNGNITNAGNYAGGILGYQREPDTKNYVNNCINTGTIKATYAGGVVGAIYSDDVEFYVNNCENSGKVISNTEGYAGGIFGYVGGSNDNLKIYQSINKGNVESDTYVGGIFGGRRNNKECAINLTVEQCASTGNLTSDSHVGGIVGRGARGNSTFNIDSCYVRGTLSGYACRVVGFIGDMNSTDMSNKGTQLSITNSYLAISAYVSDKAASGAESNARVFAVTRDNNNTVVGTYSKNVYEITVDSDNAYVRGTYQNNKMTSFPDFVAKTGAENVAAQMTTDGNLGAGKAFLEDTLNINGGYPILAWQHPCTPKFAAAQESTSGNGIRFLATVDTENLAAVGFKVVASYDKGEGNGIESFDYSSGDLFSIYTSVKENENVRTAGELGGKYVFAYGIKSLPTDKEITFKVRAYTVSADGTQEYASEIYTYTYLNGTITPVVNN